VLLSFLIVLGLAIIELWLAIPTGFIMGLDPILISIASIAGTMVGVLIAYKLTKRIRQWIIERYLYRGEQKPKSRLYRIWQKYGKEFIQSYQFSKDLQLPHDLITVGRPDAQIELVYPKIFELIH